MAEILMEKLPDVFRKYFLKEGVVHAIDQLAAVQPAAEPAEPAGDEAQEGEDGKAAAAGPSSGRQALGRRGSSSGRPASRAADKDKGEVALPAPANIDAKTPAGDTLRYAVGARARRFHARYFTDGSGHTVGELGSQVAGGLDCGAAFQCLLLNSQLLPCLSEPPAAPASQCRL